MTAEIIAVGTELLLGDIVNTNAQFLARELSALGINVYFQTVVGDNPARLSQAVELAKNRADLLITTGGLGPTVDDLTRETVAACFGLPLYEDSTQLARIEQYFAERNKVMTENNKRQAMLPRGCTVFENDWGTAPACAFEKDGKTVILLPGPPREMKPLWQKYAAPYLAAKQQGVLVSRQVRIFGMGESQMETELRDLMQAGQNPTLAPYAKQGECMVRITARAETAEQAEGLLQPVVDEVCARLGEVVYGVDVESLEQAVGRLLLERGLTLATAESCTGGLIAKRMTDVAGSSAYFMGGVVSYTNAVKQALLGVSEQTLAERGAVSPEVAEQMAEGAAKRLGADIGIGITGIAGPGGGTDEKPVGLVYFSVYDRGEWHTRKLNAKGERQDIRNLAASSALNLVRDIIGKHKSR